MKLRYNFAVVVITGLLMAGSRGIAGAAIQQLKADLATDPGAEQIAQVPPGDYKVLIINKAPKKAYGVEVDVSFTPIPPLAPPPGGGSVHLATDDCSQLEQDTTSIRNSEDEKAVSSLVASIGQNKCADTQKVNAAKAAVELTMQPANDFVYTLSKGQDLKITITRDDGKTWTFIFRTPALGNWFSSYGFVFVPNRDQRYFSKLKLGTTDRYLITHEADNSGSDFSPSLFYSWLPASRENKALSVGASAGLGFDQSNPIVFAGPMLTYHQNISLVAGIVIHKQKRLNGMYSRNQEIGENLSADQLIEQTYKPNFFFGLSFRFSANPFATTGNDSKPVQKTPGKTPDTPK